MSDRLLGSIGVCPRISPETLSQTVDGSSGYRDELLNGPGLQVFAGPEPDRNGPAFLFAISNNQPFDFQKAHVEAWLGFIGLTKVTRITVDGTLFGPEVAAEATLKAIADARRIAPEF